jgi:hypothetical protein
VGMCCLASAGLVACGEGRQDADEPSGRFQVSVSSSFPQKQSLAQQSDLVVKVRNEEGRRTVPNVAVTVRGFDYKTKQTGVADPSRPVFALNGQPETIGGFPEARDSSPKGGDTAYVDTWALGPLKPGATKTFRWKVTAVHAGPYKLRFTVAAGLNGKAKAVGLGGGAPTRTFTGRISNTAPQTRIADDGKTVIQGTR